MIYVNLRTLGDKEVCQRLFEGSRLPFLECLWNWSDFVTPHPMTVPVQSTQQSSHQIKVILKFGNKITLRSFVYLIYRMSMSAGLKYYKWTPKYSRLPKGIILVFGVSNLTIHSATVLASRKNPFIDEKLSVKLEVVQMCALLISLSAGSLLTSVTDLNPAAEDCFRLNSTKAYINQSMKPRRQEIASRPEVILMTWGKK